MSSKFRFPMAGALACLSFALGAMVMISASRAYGDEMISDSITVNLKNVNPADAKNPNSITFKIPEGGNEGKVLISLGTVSGAIPKAGYFLLCEPGFAGCGPRNDFKGISDILFRLVSGGLPGKPPAFFFYSDYKGFDAVALLKETYGVKNVKKIPKGQFLGDLVETGKPQEIGRFFYNPKRFPGMNNAVVVMSDLDTPESSTVLLVGFGLLLGFLVICHRQRSNRKESLDRRLAGKGSW